MSSLFFLGMIIASVLKTKSLMPPRRSLLVHRGRRRLLSTPEKGWTKIQTALEARFVTSSSFLPMVLGSRLKPDPFATEGQTLNNDNTTEQARSHLRNTTATSRNWSAISMRSDERKHDDEANICGKKKETSVLRSSVENIKMSNGTTSLPPQEEVSMLRDQNRALRIALSTLRHELERLRSLEDEHSSLREKCIQAEANATELSAQVKRTERLHKRAASEVNYLRRRNRDVLARNAELEARFTATQSPQSSNNLSPEARAVLIHDRRRRLRAESFVSNELLSESEEDEHFFSETSLTQQEEEENDSIAEYNNDQENNNQLDLVLPSSSSHEKKRTTTTTSATSTTVTHQDLPVLRKRSVLADGLEVEDRRETGAKPVLVPQLFDRTKIINNNRYLRRDPRDELLADKLARGSSIYQQLQSELARRETERLFGTDAALKDERRAPKDTIKNRPPRKVPPAPSRRIKKEPDSLYDSALLSRYADILNATVQTPPPPRPISPAAKTDTILAKLKRGSTLYMQIRQEQIQQRLRNRDPTTTHENDLPLTPSTPQHKPQKSLDTTDLNALFASLDIDYNADPS